MLSEIKKLKEIILEPIWKEVGNEIDLSEKKQHATLTSVILSEVPEHSLLIKADKTKLQVFVSGYANKQCDYILLTKYNKRKYALFIEMKSSVNVASEKRKKNEANSDLVVQLRGSKCLFDFFDSALKNFFKICALANEYDSRYVVLYNVNLSEISKSILPTRLPSNNTPKKFYLRQVDNGQIIPFHNLIIKAIIPPVLESGTLS